MFILDETTLFYYFRRTQPEDSNKKVAGIIKNWQKAVEIGPAAHVNTLKTGGSGRKSHPSTGSIRSGSGSTTLVKSTANTTFNRTAISALDNEEAKQNEQSDNDACGGLADEFELDGPKGEFARLSPFKGKKRMTNDVSSLFYLHYLH